MGQDIGSDNIKAAGVVHYSAMLEELKAFDVADRLVELFLNGLLPLDRPGGRQLLYEYWRDRPNRLPQLERRQLYTRTLGLPAGDSDGATANREFEPLWSRFVAAVASLAREDPTVNDEIIGRAAREIAAHLSLRGGEVARVVPGLRKEVEALLHVLSHADIQRAIGARNVWHLIERISARDLGGAAPVTRLRVQAQTGAVVFAWLANHATHLDDGTVPVLDSAAIREQRRGPSPATDPTDYELVDACEKWLTAAVSQRDPEPSST